jgi:ethanolamine utilization protein EutQ (cupin superfamily)
VGLTLFAFGSALLALLALTSVPAGSFVVSGAALSGAVELLQTAPPEIFAAFQGSTAEYGGYGFASGGRFSAALQVHHAGSRSTSFLLDHRLQYIVEGEIHVADGTGQHFVGKAGDLFYLAYGSNVTLYTPSSALTYLSIADATPPLYPEQVATLQPDAYRKWVSRSASSAQVEHFPQIKDKHDRVFGDSHLFFEGLGCWKWNTSQLPSNAWTSRSKGLMSPSWNFCCGIFHLRAGPPAFTSYTYKNHEELDFIIGGEFHAKDATGHAFTVKKGDLVHNPRHMNLEYTTPTTGTFFSTSLSPIDDFFPH